MCGSLLPGPRKLVVYVRPSGDATEVSRRVLRQAVQLLQEGWGGARLLQEEEEVLRHDALALGLLALRARLPGRARLPLCLGGPPCTDAGQLYDRCLLRMLPQHSLSAWALFACLSITLEQFADETADCQTVEAERCIKHALIYA